MAKYDFFISYSTKDKDIAFKILEEIESTGHTCWIAPRNIPYGTPYARAIMEGIDECDTFLVLITDNSIKSEDVLNEVDNAHAIKKTIIPVRLTDTQLPRELNYYLSRTQWLSLDSQKPHKIVESLNLKNIVQNKENTDLFDKHDDLTGEQNVISGVTANIPPKENSQPEKGIKNRSNFLKKLLTVCNGKTLWIIITIISLLWLVIAFVQRTPNDNLLLTAFILDLAMLILLVYALIKPSKLGLSSRKECYLYIGLPVLFLFTVGFAYAETEIKSDSTANSIMDSSNMQDFKKDSLIINTQGSAKQQLAEEAFNKKDYSQAIKYFNEIADSGDSYGLYMLGKCYYSGLGVEKDFKIAFEFYSKAAMQKNLEAINSMGVCYLKGRGVKQDFDKAAECFNEAAVEGLPIAQANLADCYVYGNGVEQDYSIAKDWYERAANQEYAPAAFNIGRLYYNGRPGVGLNYEKAANWYKTAADLGLAEAQNSLGVCYLKGQGVERNQTEAFKWFEKAAMQGNPSGLYNLANCYRDGNGVTKDREKAKQLYKEAADNGSSTALAALKKL